MYIHGQYCPVLGRVTTDQIMVDVTYMEICIRDRAIIFTFLVGFRYLFSEFQHLRDDFFISN